MEENKLKIELMALAQGFEIHWAYYLMSNGRLFGKKCKDSARKFLQAFDEFADMDGKIKEAVAERLGNKTEMTITEFRRWSERPEIYPSGDAAGARLALWDFFGAVEKYLFLDLGLRRFPERDLNFGELLLSTNYVKWHGHLPRTDLWTDPESLVKNASASPTIIVMGDIRRSEHLMRYAASAEDFTKRMEEFIETAQFMVDEYGGFFDKFTGDGFIVYFNEAVGKLTGTTSHIERFLNFVRNYKDFAERHFTSWTAHVRELPNEAVGLALGADLGTISLQKLNNHVFAVGDAMVSASRLTKLAKANEILVSKQLYEILRDRVDLKFEERAGKTKFDEELLARALSFQKSAV